MIPGEMKIKAGEIEINQGREMISITVANTGRCTQISANHCIDF